MSQPRAHFGLHSQTYTFTYKTPTPVVTLPLEDPNVQTHITILPPMDTVVTEPNFGQLLKF